VSFYLIERILATPLQYFPTLYRYNSGTIGSLLRESLRPSVPIGLNVSITIVAPNSPPTTLIRDAGTCYSDFIKCHSFFLYRAQCPLLGQIIRITFQDGIRQSQTIQFEPVVWFSPLGEDVGKTKAETKDIFLLFRSLFSNLSNFRLVGALRRTFSECRNKMTISLSDLAWRSEIIRPAVSEKFTAAWPTMAK